MARMNLRLRRDAPGASVFWMVLGIGVAILLLLGIYLYATGADTRVETEGPDIIAGEGDDVPGTSSFSEGEVATREADLPTPAQTDDGAGTGTGDAVDIEPAEPAAGPEAPAAGDADAEAGEQLQE